MLNKLLPAEVVAFIKEHEHSDLNRLLLNKHKYPHIPIDLVVNQIKARTKAKYKLPLWYKTEGVIFPPLLSMEQCSSEQTALFKASLIKGTLAIDLTGGAGVDSFYLSKQFEKVLYVEQNKELAQLTKHNFKVLGADNITVINQLSESFLAEFKGLADLIYIDPARRDQNQKVFLFESCSPNILSLQKELLEKAKRVIIKASPMLDISKGIHQLLQVEQVHVVALKNEVKELLFIQSQQTTGSILIQAIDLFNKSIFSTTWEDKMSASIGEIKQYLYEPNAAILKTGKTDTLCALYKVDKLNPNTHLFTSNLLIKNFPGRVFKIEKEVKYDKKEIQKLVPSKKANIAVRNFPDSVEALRKKTGIVPGGTTYLFGVRTMNNLVKILICKKYSMQG